MPTHVYTEDVRSSGKIEARLQLTDPEVAESSDAFQLLYVIVGDPEFL